MQIHHIDGNPANNVTQNLAVLCFECHRETQIRGGFDRKLDTDQVILYRDHWYETVRRRRDALGFSGLPSMSVGPPADEESINPEIVTSLAEIYREREDWWQLASLYERVGNTELRDKYLARALEVAAEDGNDFMVILIRRMQRRLDEVPTDVVERVLAEYEAPDSDWTVHHSLLLDFGRPVDAARVLAKGLVESLDDGRPFTAAYYLTRTEELVEALFRQALREAAERDDLWWQVRALQELGWDSELRALVESHAAEIEQSDDLLLKRVLAEVRGDSAALHEIAKAVAESPIGIYFTRTSADEDTGADAQAATEPS